MNEKNERSYDDVAAFRNYLLRDEKSNATTEKYCRDVAGFCAFLGEQVLTKEVVIAYKNFLVEKGYAVRSVNSMLASVNSFLRFLHREDCHVKNIRTQQQVYCSEDQELTRDDYLRLLQAAKERPRLYLMLQTLCGTGIRVSELGFFTVEAVTRGEVRVSCKSKVRVILIPENLRQMLLLYAKNVGITDGVIFRTRGGNAVNRSNIWHDMKALCLRAGVNPEKVFPHNLRKLFARTFYSVDKDIAELADILGHSSINTTRIYIVSTGTEHKRKMEHLGLVFGS